MRRMRAENESGNLGGSAHSFSFVESWDAPPANYFGFDALSCAFGCGWGAAEPLGPPAAGDSPG